MSNYIFFIGGSGARAYTALIHSAASGILNTENVNTLIIDADISNKANEKSINLYRKYQEIYELLSNKENRTIFTCEINMMTQNILSPVESNAVTLRDAIGTVGEDRKRLLDCFYTEEEKSQNLQHGFYAHPNIGCVFFSDFKNKEFDSCLSQIERELDGGQKVSVALVGSIFGGTGAAGIPTIFKILKEKFCGNNNWGNLCISGIFFVPYFKVCDTDQEKNITIRSDRFYFNTYEALSYYNATNPDGLKSIYIVGQQSLDFVNNQYADGGAAQDNKPHMVELYAALAIDKFFSHPEQSGVFGSIRTKKLGWNGFPRVDRDNPTQMTYMADFARAQAVFVAEICGFIETDGEKLDNWCKKRGIMVPQWYVKYGMKNQEQIKQAEQIKSYGVAFLDWLYKVNCTYDGSERLHLDERICLFGSALESVYQISTEQREKIEDRNWLKEFRNKFNTFVDVTSNVEYVLDKALLILSMAGIVSGSSAALGAVGLFLKIVALAGGQKEKGINARNNRSI